jgi:hypothetical protein
MMLLSTIPQYEAPVKDKKKDITETEEQPEEVDSMDAFLKLGLK